MPWVRTQLVIASRTVASPRRDHSGCSHMGCVFSVGAAGACRAQTFAQYLRSSGDSMIHLNSSASTRFSGSGNAARFGLSATQSKSPRRVNAPHVSKCTRRPVSRNARDSGAKFHAAGSPPVITTNSAPCAACAADTSAVTSCAAAPAVVPSRHVSAESHHGQRTGQPCRRMKNAERPACTPSPCQLWKVSLTA